MLEIGEGDFDSAFVIVKRYTWLPDVEIDNMLVATKSQMELINNRFGNFVGHELIKAEVISESLVKYTYISKCENHALVWNFLFYKGKDKWTLNGFTFNDRLGDL